MTAYSLASHLVWAKDRPVMCVPSLLCPIFPYGSLRPHCHTPLPRWPLSVWTAAPLGWPLAAQTLLVYEYFQPFHSDLLKSEWVCFWWPGLLFLPLQRLLSSKMTSFSFLKQNMQETKKGRKPAWVWAKLTKFSGGGNTSGIVWLKDTGERGNAF